MALIFLIADCQASGPSAFIRGEAYWNTTTHALEVISSNVLACQVYEVAVGTQVDQWCEVDGTQRTAYYKAGTTYVPGTNLVGITSVANAPACPLPTSLSTDPPLVDPASNPNAADGAVVIPYFTPYPPVTGVLNGQVVTQTTTAGTLTFTGLPAGTYPFAAEDAHGGRVQLPGIVVGTSTGVGVVREWLRYTIREETDPNPPDPDHPGTLTLLDGSWWDPLLKSVRAAVLDITGDYTYPAAPALYARPLGLLVDAYYLSGGVVYRRVYHRDDDGDGVGDGDVRFVDTTATGTPATPGLALDNIIVQHVHQLAAPAPVPGPATGRVLLEAHSLTPGPLTYTRVADGATNATGRFAGLAPGPHLFRIQDAGGNTLETTVTIEDRYRQRWFVRSRAVGGALVQVDLLDRDNFTGTATELTGTGRDFLERSWSTAGQDVEGVLPEAQGQACRLSVYQQEAGQFSDVFLSGDDRRFRVDVRVNGLLVFRGYIAPDLYTEDLSTDTGGAITFTAGDGLGSLRSTNFLNHESQPLTGRWPLLNTLLHCLSRCEAGPLPLYVQTDLQEVQQAADTDWLPTFESDRAGYADTGDEAKEWTCREVVEALLRPAQAVLVQRDGAWWVVSANAAGTPAAFYAYAPDGEPLAAPSAQVPLLLKPAGYSTGNLFWVNAEQRAQTLAAARAVVASTKLLLVKNQLSDGLLRTWQPDLLRPLGWSGTLNVERFDQNAAEDAKPVAGGTKLRTGTTQPPGAVLVSPGIAFRAGSDETPVRVALRLRVRPAGNGNDLLATVQARATVNGVALAPLLHWEVGSQEKEVTVEAFVPFGQGANGVLRLEILPPTVIIPFGTAPTAVDIYEVTLQVLPGAVEWPEADQITSLSETGFLVLPEVVLHHADTPRLPLSNGTLRPVPTMDAQAWRHVLTYGDGSPTTAWRRSNSLAPAPLLETAALDRMDLRRAPVSVFTGPVHGPAVHALGFGSVVDCPQDAPGLRFWCVGVAVSDLEQKAELTLREIGLSDPEALPVNRLIAHTGAALVSDEGFVLAYQL